MKTRTIIMISIFATGVVGAAGYFGFANSGQEQPTPEAPQTVAVTSCDVTQSVEAPGKLDNTSETKLLMPVDGSISEVFVRPGDHVSSGQVLATLDDQSQAEARIALKDAEAAYKKAYTYRMSLNGKQWIQDVVINYVRGQEIPEVKWHKAYVDEQTIQKADNDLALKKAKLDEAQATLDQMEFKAPFEGVVIEVDAVEGQPHKEEDTLFKISDPKALEVQANVTQEDYPLLVPGQPAVIYFDARPDVVVNGKVDRIVPKLVEGTSPTYDIFISLDEVPDGLADGMTVDSAVTIAKRESVLCLPRSVVHASGDNNAVLKIWNGLITEERPVKIGLRGDANVEIISGVQEGELVVVR